MNIDLGWSNEGPGVQDFLGYADLWLPMALQVIHVLHGESLETNFRPRLPRRTYSFSACDPLQQNGNQ